MKKIKLTERHKLIILVGLAVISLIIVGYVSYSEYQRSRIIPLCFSELSQLKREQGKNLGVLTEYYASLNDASMKIFEAQNEAVGKSSFANELEMHIDPTFRIHKHDLPMLLTNLPRMADKALDKLSGLQNISMMSGKVFSASSQAWTATHDDVYHTEYYTYTSTDSKGNTTTHTGSRQVYDYTIHTYHYYPAPAHEALVQLDILIQTYSSVLVPEILKVASTTQAEGEYTSEKTWKHYNSKMKMEDIITLIKSWDKRTTYVVNINKIVDEYASLVKMRDAYASSLNTAHYMRYRTYSSYDAGPAEYQRACEVNSTSGSINVLCEEIIRPIAYVRDQSIPLMDTIRKYISIKLDKEKGNGDELERNIRTTIGNMYGKNFKNSYTLVPYRGWVLALWFVGGLLGWLGLCFFIYRKF